MVLHRPVELAGICRSFDIDRAHAPVENVEMVLLLFAAIGFAFLVLGSLVFLGCVLVPQPRRFALSAALWCALWGPCSVGWMLCAGLGLVAAAFITKTGDMQTFHAPKLLAAFGWGYLVLGVAATTTVATVASWLHQVLVRRLTFALFRLYATLVSAGIGSVFGWCFGWKNVSHHLFSWSLLGMLVLIVGFGTAAYKGARGLRGEAPMDFTWISPVSRCTKFPELFTG
jgi:hypothetical protein